MPLRQLRLASTRDRTPAFTFFMILELDYAELNKDPRQWDS